jgi:hypothetical protein
MENRNGIINQSGGLLYVAPPYLFKDTTMALNQSQSAAKFEAMHNQIMQMELANKKRAGEKVMPEAPHPETMLLMYVGEDKSKPIVNKWHDQTFTWSVKNNWTCEVPWHLGRARADNQRAPWWIEVLPEDVKDAKKK